MSACRGVFVLCSSRWRTYVVSGLRNIEVYAIQGCNKCIVKVSFLGPRDGVLFIEVFVFQGVRISTVWGYMHVSIALACIYNGIQSDFDQHNITHSTA